MTTTEFWLRIGFGAVLFIAGFAIGNTLGLIVLLVGLAVIAHCVIDALRVIRKAKKIQAQRR